MREVLLLEITECGQVSAESINRLLCQLSSTCTPISEGELAEIIASPNSHLFVLFDDERAIGMITVATYQTPTGRKGWIEDVVVDKAYRGHHYGQFMVEKTIDYIRQIGDTTLMLTSRPQRVTANRLYQKSGFKRKETNVYRMKIQVAPPQKNA